MSVFFRGPDQIEIDGLAEGGILDVMRNHKSRLPEVLIAYGVFLQDWNKRWIDAGHFVARFTPQQTREVYTSADPNLIAARQLLDSYVAANYAVVLDDVQVIGVIDYMISIGILTGRDRARLLIDSNSFERYTGVNVMPEPEPNPDTEPTV
jgi:hypothetical protein